MNWPIFLIIAVVLMAIAGITGGWLLPMAGIEGAIPRGICFGIAGAIVGLIYLRMKGAPRA